MRKEPKIIKVQKSDMNGMGGFDYSRVLRAIGHPKDSILEVYRGDTLAYTIKPLKWGASRRVAEDVNRGPYVTKWTPMSEETKQKLKDRRKSDKD